MNYKSIIGTFLLFANLASAQNFDRNELPTQLSQPWEITYGPDNFLWLTQANGIVTRVDPNNGTSENVYTAPDYFSGSPLEKLNACNNPNIGSGTLGLALHPDFINPNTSYIYYMYSYNQGTVNNPDTKFRVKRLTWDASTKSVIADSNIINSISSGYDHLGGRLLAVKQNGKNYLYLSVGDHGISETNSPDCYSPQSTNPNNQAQNPMTDNGKIHRFNMDGSLPDDNPIENSSVFTRGHRNPQGLMYNSKNNIVYDIEHGDRTDDEINELKSGKNYGWKNIRGYHDGKHPGELDYINSYTPNPLVQNDGIEEAFFAWCDTEAPDPSAGFTDWCTVAPSGGAYYSSTSINTWEHSLLIVTLKDGSSTDMEVYNIGLMNDGSLAPSTANKPNPRKYFSEDQSSNGRLRDIAISSDGKKIYLINNGGTDRDKITVYTYTGTTGIDNQDIHKISMFPNPIKSGEVLTVTGVKNIQEILMYNAQGKLLKSANGNGIVTNKLSAGLYFVKVKTANSEVYKIGWIELL